VSGLDDLRAPAPSVPPGRILFSPERKVGPVLRRNLPLVLLLLLGAAGNPLQAQEPTLIFLVRHAERADDGQMTGQEDPHLSEAGRARAQALARLLADAGITQVHSSDYLRTRETAAPTAEAAGLPVSIYDVRDLPTFAETLKATPGRHLVVGHSNSTPDLVAILGGDPHGEIAPLEYDRLYLLSLGPSGAQTVLLRFGQPFHPSP